MRIPSLLRALFGAWPEPRLLLRPWDRSKLRDAFCSWKILPLVVFLPILSKAAAAFCKNLFMGTISLRALRSRSEWLFRAFQLPGEMIEVEQQYRFRIRAAKLFERARRPSIG